MAAVALLGATAFVAIFHARGHAVSTVRGTSAIQRLVIGDDEHSARRHFYRNHPGRQPLNWRIAEEAIEYYERQPMGRFVLHQNDCSDYTDSIVDEALGYGARDSRGSDQHTAMNDSRLWNVIVWDGVEPLLPGDVVSVRHSPWYAPDPDACGHVGIIGADSMVYDWTKLRSWKAPRYGRNSVEWFTSNSPTPGNVWVWRLRPRYRYMVAPLPVGGDG